LAETPNTAVRSEGSATPKRERAHSRTSSTKNFSCVANRSTSKTGEYSWSRSSSSFSRWVPTIIVGGTSVASRDAAPLRDQLAVTGDHDRLGWNWRDVHRHLRTTVIVERLGDELSRDVRRHCYCLPPVTFSFESLTARVARGRCHLDPPDFLTA